MVIIFEYFFKILQVTPKTVGEDKAERTAYKFCFNKNALRGSKLKRIFRLKNYLKNLTFGLEFDIRHWPNQASQFVSHIK